MVYFPVHDPDVRVRVGPLPARGVRKAAYQSMASTLSSCLVHSAQNAQPLCRMPHNTAHAPASWNVLPWNVACPEDETWIVTLHMLSLDVDVALPESEIVKPLKQLSYVAKL